MSIHRSLCIPLPLGRLSQRISRISTHSSGALYPGFSPTTLGPTISSGTHRYAVASPSEVGWVGGWRGAREVAPTRGNSPGGQRSPGHWVANEPGTRGDMTGHRVDGPQPRRHRPPSSLPPLGMLEGVSCHRVRILRRSAVVVATKVPNPGQRLPNSRPILPTGFLPLALV